MLEENKEKDLKQLVWEKYYGSNIVGLDPFGRLITKTDFELDHIIPIHENGSIVIDNLIPLHFISNYEKGNKKTGLINGKFFIVEINETDKNGKNIGKLIVDGISIGKM